MFKVGDLVTGMENDYTYTTEKSLCIVNSIVDDTRMNVSIICHAKGYDCENTCVAQSKFVLCTYEEFKEKYPNAVFVGGHTLEEVKQNEIKQEVKEMELRMKKENGYVLTEEEREALRNEIIELLEEYDYNPTKSAVNKIIDEWVKNKGWMINLFKQHPNYNGKFQIIFDSDYQRCCNKDMLYNFACWMYNRANEVLLVPYQIGKFSYREVRNIRDTLSSISGYMENIQYCGRYTVLVNGKDRNEIRKEFRYWDNKLDEYYNNEEVYVTGGQAYRRESYALNNNVYDFKNHLAEYTEHIATEEFANFVNKKFPTIKAVAGQKVSRIVNKVCKLIGIDKHPDYNREFAKYADAINPLTIKRHTILSCHPVDYLTMSFGNSWASCHTIDKGNRRGMPDNYSGCYSSGTVSYMLDESSFVYYTVDKDYNGNEYELQDKINRNMFHMGEDKLIQARVYPQATDGETGIYRQIREIAQKVVADCLGVPNMWKNVKGTGECGSVIHSSGTHYKDYLNYSDCNVSYLKGDTEDVNKDCINVGHRPICPNCGKEHSYEDAVECSNCYSDDKTCYDCGYTYNEEDMHYINGRWYCDDCCFYCEYHGEYEVGDSTYIESYGRVCDDALDSCDFYRCEYCDEYHYRNSSCDEHIETEDGTEFCCPEHAYEGGYMKTKDGYWYPEDEVYYCENCCEHVHADDWDSEHDCCNNCVPEEIEEDTTETEEREAV